MLHFEPFDGTMEEWDAVLERFPDREVLQTSAWLRFLAESQGGAVILAALKDHDDTVGYFAGLIVQKFGLRILGSPFIGWTTERMGIRLMPNVPKRAAVDALMRYAFQYLRCVHLEIADLNITPADVDGLGFETRVGRGHVIDLTPPEETLFGNMDSACRRCIRKAQKEGVVIEESHDEEFAEDYYQQLKDVFAKQSLVPTYDKRRVQLLIRHLLPTGNLLLLRARDPEGRCIATGVFPAMNAYMYFWGGASWRQFQILRPNESIQWYAMRYWKQRGMAYCDLCGAGQYKRKYGTQPFETYFLSRSNRPWIALARKIAFKSFRVRQRVLGFLQRKRSDANKDDASGDE